MILNSENIKTYLSKAEVQGKTKLMEYKLHAPSGVFFATQSDEKTLELEFFSVAAINAESETQEKRTFPTSTEKDFFEAVEYFEKLINDRIKSNQSQPPSTALFVWVKNNDCEVILSQDPTNPIKIKKDDVDKCLSLPVNKTFGLLNMFESDNPEYEVIKSKFALLFDEQISKSKREELNLSEKDCKVFKMTPFQTDENSQEEPDDVEENDTNEDESDEDESGEDDDSNEEADSNEKESNEKESSDGKPVKQKNSHESKNNSDIYNFLSNEFEVTDFKKRFKTLNSFMSIMESFDAETIKTKFSEPLGYEGISKTDFLIDVKEKMKKYF